MPITTTLEEDKMDEGLKDEPKAKKLKPLVLLADTEFNREDLNALAAKVNEMIERLNDLLRA